jgi:hypothetical protein
MVRQAIYDSMGRPDHEHRRAAGAFRQAEKSLLILINDGATFIGSATRTSMVGFDSLSTFRTGRKVRAVDLLMGATFITF